MTQQHPAGWYPQPDGTQRYWDGSRWTEHTAPIPQRPTTPAPAPQRPTAPALPQQAPATFAPQTGPGFAGQPATQNRPLWQKKRVLIPAAALAAIVGIGALASGGGGSQSAVPAPTPSAVQTSEPVPETEQSPANAAAAETFIMPDLVGANLQEAQDQLQALGSYLMDQQDASGEGRIQLDDSNWQVCTQEPAAGQEVPITATVVLASVKNSENCPGSEPATETETVKMTSSQEQAVRTAEQYLDYTAFSRKGLIDQLKYEGFSKKDATFAVDHIDVNWRDQAVAKAEQYLDHTAFSRKGLIGQLKYEGFSKKHATYAVDHIDVDWNEQAAKKAEQYLDYTSFSRKKLIAQLQYEGFTRKQAEHGAKAAGL